MTKAVEPWNLVHSQPPTKPHITSYWQTSTTNPVNPMLAHTRQHHSKDAQKSTRNMRNCSSITGTSLNILSTILKDKNVLKHAPKLMFVIYVWIKVLYLYQVVWLRTPLSLMLPVPPCLCSHLVDNEGNSTQQNLTNDKLRWKGHQTHSLPSVCELTRRLWLFNYRLFSGKASNNTKVKYFNWSLGKKGNTLYVFSRIKPLKMTHQYFTSQNYDVKYQQNQKESLRSVFHRSIINLKNYFFLSRARKIMSLFYDSTQNVIIFTLKIHHHTYILFCLMVFMYNPSCTKTICSFR